MIESLKNRVTTSPKDPLVQCVPLLMNACKLDDLEMNNFQGGNWVRGLEVGAKVYRAVRDGVIYETVRTVVVHADDFIDNVSEAMGNIGSSYATDNPTWDESYYARSKYGGFKRG